MSAAQREKIKEYLVEGFMSGNTFSDIKVNQTPLKEYSLENKERFLALWKDQERFLVAVHADIGYLQKLEEFECILLRDMTAQNIACVSVFDDALFYREDAKGRIHLKGIEKRLLPFGPLTYFRNQNPRLDVVQFRGSPIVEDKLGQRDLLSHRIMDPSLIAAHHPPFDLSPGTHAGNVYLTSFVSITPSQDFTPVPRSSRRLADLRTQFLRDELAGGRDFDGELTAEDLRKLGKHI